MNANTVDSDIDKILTDPNIPWEIIQGTTVLVTGATGLLGSLIVQSLIRLGCSVYVAVRNIDKAKKMFGEYVQYVILDIRDTMQTEMNAEYIIHCASITESSYMISNPVETLDTSYRGTYNVLEYARKCNARSVLYLSSMEAYGEVYEPTPMEENDIGFIDLENVRSSYPEGKRVSELLCRSYHFEYGVNVKMVRLAQTFGPGVNKDDKRVFMQFAKNIIDGKNIILRTYGKTYSNFCYTSDAVRGIFTILLKGASGETYNVCNAKETRTIKEIAELITTEIGKGKTNIVFEIDADNKSGYAKDTMLHLSTIKIEQLGWKPEVSMLEAYKRLIMYLIED